MGIKKIEGNWKKMLYTADDKKLYEILIITVVLLARRLDSTPVKVLNAIEVELRDVKV